MLVAVGCGTVAEARSNVALGKPATQSSDADPVNTPASNAVDGNPDSISHTQADAGAWLEVDLQTIYSIDMVRLRNRRGCCQDRLSNFYVLVSDVPFTSTDLATARAQSGVGSYYFAGALGDSTSFYIGRSGRYVRVQLTSASQYLHIAELEVFDRDSGYNVALSSRGGVPNTTGTYPGFLPTYPIDGFNTGAFWNNDTYGTFPNAWTVRLQMPHIVNEIDVYTVQDGYAETEPTLATTFTQEGIVDFHVQYWTGSAWVDVPGGNITGNNHAWNRLTFAPVTTDRIRVLINNALDAYSRITEVAVMSPNAWGVVNGSFEIPVLGDGIAIPDGAAWTFYSAGTTTNQSAFTSGNPDTTNGSQVTWLQGISFIEQSVALPGAGSYVLSFLAAQRGNYQYGTQIVQASIDGVVIGNVEPADTAYGVNKMTFNVASGGTHTLRLAGVGLGNGDHTAFVDDVRIDVAPPPAVLVAQYHLEDAVYNGTAGELVDSSGQGHHGVAVGSSLPTPGNGNPPVTTNPGTCGYTDFPGPFNGGGAFSVTGLGLSTASGDKSTVTFWLYWDGEDNMVPVGFDNYFVWIAYGSIGFNSYDGDRQYGADWYGLANGWHHIAAVFTNNDDAQNELWIDGVSRGLTNRNGRPPDTRGVVGSNFMIGGSPSHSDMRFRGSAIDEVKVYSGGATPAQIAADYAARHACSAAVPPGAFNVFETSTPSGAVSGVIHTKVAGTTFSVDAVALNAAGTELVRYFGDDVLVELLDAHDNSGTFTGSCRSSWVPAAGHPATTQNFGGAFSARLTLSLAENEAWRDLRFRISTPATGTPTTVACSTDDFAMRPQSLAAFAATDGNASSAGTSRTLANTASAGGAVHKAGRPFTLGATAVNGISATTSRYDGTPSAVTSECTGSACPVGWITVANENNSFTLAGSRSVRYGATPNWAYQTLSGTVGCNNSVFGDPYSYVYKHCEISVLAALAVQSPAFVSGTLNTSATYGEAASFALQLVDDTFAAVDASDGSTVAERTFSSPIINVGRFVPDHFDITPLAAPMFRTFDSASCVARSFSYVGQPFGYVNPAQATVLARNAAGGTTINYAGSLWKLIRSSLLQAFTTTPATPTIDATAVTAAALTSNGDGTGLLVGSAGDKLRFNRGGAALAPFNANVSLTLSVQDTSEAGYAGNGVIATASPFSFSNIAFDAGNQMRYGVLRLTPAYGSELIDLPVLLEALYWDGQRMVLNTADHCTTIAPAAMAMGNFLRNLAACKTAIAAAPLSLVGGRAFAKLAKPGTGNSGSVDLALQLGASASGQTCTAVGGAASTAGTANLPWLQGRWSGAAAFDQNPATRASFGQYRSPLIYQRESF